MARAKHELARLGMGTIFLVDIAMYICACPCVFFTCFL